MPGRDDFESRFGRGFSSDTRSFYEREAHRWGHDSAERSTRRELLDAHFGRGELAGRTGDPFSDKPFFNPWAKGGAFNCPPERSRFPEPRGRDLWDQNDDRFSGLKRSRTSSRSSRSAASDSSSAPNDNQGTVTPVERHYVTEKILVVSERAQSQVRWGDLILFSDTSKLLTPREIEAFHRATINKNTQGKTRGGLSASFSQASSGFIGVSETIPAEIDKAAVPAFLATRRKEVVAQLLHQLGSYMSESERRSIGTANPSFEPLEKHQVLTEIRVERSGAAIVKNPLEGGVS
ncbi:MAG: hypothetical protein NDJ24_04640 [Alphaproteobacteria bacterium]|nr:hypothetical protein [Alphaproteobacteria bacterium]